MNSARTVAILFTDLVGSTDLWSRNGDAMAGALATHDALAEAAFAGARTTRHTGDGSMAVFDSVEVAIGAAGSLMAAMAATHWPTDEPLRLRMGIHVGPALERAGNWFGTAVNRAARVGDAANGGQLLLTQAADLAARDAVPDHRSLELGRAHLKGIDRDELLFHVQGPEFIEPTPPRTRLASATPPPVPRTGLLGREDLVSEVSGLLEDSRVVSLTGVGGVGKTQVALAVVESNRTGAAYVDLAPKKADAVADAFGEALGISADQRSNPTAVAAASRGRSMLVVDNCEHVIEAVGGILETILANNPDIRVLVTSREAIGVQGEHVVPVPPLSLDSAMDVFVQRATTVGAAVDPDDAAIAEICSRLDCVPLAIELAAGRAAHLSPTQILERLDQRFRLLSSRRTGSERSHSLEEVMDWSYQLLDETEQSALQAACVFVGGFDLDAFVAVAGRDEFDALDELASLSAKSLLIPRTSPEGTRYAVLETVRLYGLERSAKAGKSALLSQAHAEYYRESAGSPGSWVPSLRVWETYVLAPGSQVDEANVRTALVWFDEQADLVSLGHLAVGALLTYETYLWDSGLRLYERDDVVAALDGRLQEFYVLASAFAANGRGDWSAQMSFANRLLAESRDPEIRAVATALAVLIGAFFDGFDAPTMIEAAITDLAGSRPDLERSLRGRATDSAFGRGDALGALGTLAEQAEAGDFVATVDLAKAYVMLGRFDDALEWLEDAPSIWGTFNELWRRLVETHSNAGRDTTLAVHHLVAAEQTLRKRYDALVEAELLVGAAAIALGADDPSHAARLLAESGANFRTPGGYGIYNVVRSRARERLSREEVDRIRADAGGRSPHEAFILELDRLRSIVDPS